MLLINNKSIKLIPFLTLLPKS
ncbi:unnamed protein product, partial [Vitis vinifera]|uniref:Uncharacterized protein n=1 Tax=Vitis vinifera TaxID=29760 RepID=D7T3X3_VITVI